ncbi:MAG TPA: FkbM family methyltransferase [Bacteroidia bacterium]|jgi:FkbM family methyltransferase|nr:FkbM family methyltransferase [Bacteroidia bacterium]
MQHHTIARYRNLLRHIRNWPLYFTRPLLRKGYDEIFFVTRGNPLRFQVPCFSLLLVFEEIFISDFYGIDALLKKLPPRPVILDVGANVGYFEMMLFSKIAEATVYAYEPIPSNYALFRQNVALNPSLGDHICLFNRAVTGTPQESVELFVETEEENSVIASVYSDFNPRNHFAVRVPAISLREIIEEMGIERADMVKIDCEGSEYPIIYETPASCWEKIAFLTVEVHDLDEDQRNVGHLTRFLESQGYEVSSALAHSNCHTLEAIRKNK